MYRAAEHPRIDSFRSEAEHTLRFFERSAMAVFPSPWRRKGTYVSGWQAMASADAHAISRRDLAIKPVNLAGRTGDGVAVFDLDAKNGVDPNAMLEALRRLVGPAIIAIVETSRGFHIWLRVVESVGNGFCAFIGDDIFSGPHLAMLPPSVHPSGHRYAWRLEPREPDAAAAASRCGGRTALAPAPPAVQEEFVRLMDEAGVSRAGARPQALHCCPWHDDRSPSLSINWDAAVFYCFSESCDARGGIGGLRRRLGADTPSCRQWPTGRAALVERDGQDHLSGDKSGCGDLDVAARRLADGLEQLGFDERGPSVLDCRSLFRVGKCTSCARTPAFPISCGHPLRVRCMPGRLAADWARHRASLPAKVNVVLLRPRDLTFGSPGVLRTVRSRFAEWRRRAGVTAGIYGARLDREHGGVIMLALPSDVHVPESSRAFDVEVVALCQTPGDFLAWLQSQYVEEAQAWSTTDELKFLIDETKARRRFQGFGAVYGDAAEIEPRNDREEVQMDGDSGTNPDERRPLGRISGGAFKGKRAKGDQGCPFCGGVIELYQFTVPAAEMRKVGNHWLWDVASAGPPEGRRHARCRNGGRTGEGVPNLRELGGGSAAQPTSFRVRVFQLCIPGA